MDAGDLCPGRRQTLFQNATVRILAHHADTDGQGAERRQIGGHRAGAAAARFRLRHPQNGDRGFGADPRGIPVDVDIEHEVPGDEDPRPAKIPNGLQ